MRKKMIHKIISIVLMSGMVVSLAYGLEFKVDAEETAVHYGKSGDLDWSINSAGLLTINGTGNYYEYEEDYYNLNLPPWCEYSDEIIRADVNVTGITSTAFMFNQCERLESVDFSDFDTSNVTHMSGMFLGCSGLTSLNLKGFDTSAVKYMDMMFTGCSGLTTLDISSLNTSGVTDMLRMFSGCSGITALNLSSFDTSNVTDMAGMFEYCSGLTTLDLNNFDTSNVTDMAGMFECCSGLRTLDLRDFDTSNVTRTFLMFHGCSSLTTLNLSGFDMSNVTDMLDMFLECGSLTTLQTPKNVHDYEGLPHLMQDEAGNLYDGLPEDLPYSILLKKAGSTGETETVPAGDENSNSGQQPNGNNQPPAGGNSGNPEEVTANGSTENAVTGHQSAAKKPSVSSRPSASDKYGAKKQALKKRVTIRKLKAGKRSIKITWKKIRGIDGYVIQYSQSKKFKKAKKIRMRGANNASGTLKRLKTGKKYYIRIRTYFIWSGRQNYSGWSKVKSKKAK